jgi:hypothetical protein
MIIEVTDLVDNINLNIQDIEETIYLEVADIGEQGLQGKEGGFITKTAGENINSHAPVAIVNNLVYKLDASNPLHQFAFVGFTLTSVTMSNEVEIKQIGEIALNGWGLTPNQQYLAGVGGALITSNSSISNFTKVIGYSTTSDTLQIIKDSITINK